jgi:drug/metabolite transporter (DMT)-like permease
MYRNETPRFTPSIVAGIALIVVAVFALAFGGLSLQHRVRKVSPLPVTLGALSLVGGVGLIVANLRKD